MKFTPRTCDRRGLGVVINRKEADVDSYPQLELEAGSKLTLSQKGVVDHYLDVFRSLGRIIMS